MLLKFSVFILLLMKTLYNSSLDGLWKQQTYFSGSSTWVLYLPGLFLFTPLQSIVKQCCSSLLARSTKTLLSHIEQAGTYFVVVCLQLLWTVLAAVLYNTIDGKMLRTLVCDKIFFQLYYYMKDTDTMIPLFSANC